MRFFTSQNKQNKHNDFDVTSSDYPQTVEIPTSASSSSPDDHTPPNKNDNNSDDEGYNEFLRVCMNSMVSFFYYCLQLQSIIST